MDREASEFIRATSAESMRDAKIMYALRALVESYGGRIDVTIGNDNLYTVNFDWEETGVPEEKQKECETKAGKIMLEFGGTIIDKEEYYSA